ncbi:hypothetical protein SAMN02799620_03867 [Mycolicibacterium fluoranthenivorans]|uniref:Uncharacterized protein n=2 Tax=Mycolicibacterium fluoranthenivorans TaxID=258505 RepID=A0A1G4WNA5_9MYCO|nr:hypothetical protein SAMN02799620_03867 [Mycolicibacterium fluoranthenivorans]
MRIAVSAPISKPDRARPTLFGGSALKSPRLNEKARKAGVVSLIALGMGLASATPAYADDLDADPAPAPVQAAQVQVGAITSEGANPAAVAACAQFAQVLDGSAQYYGDFADSLEGSGYSDPAVASSNSTGRTALREAAGISMDAANTPGLPPDISDPMRTWSLGATKLLVKMGLRIPGDSLNGTATEMNNQATRVQEACAAAGTHA